MKKKLQKKLKINAFGLLLLLFTMASTIASAQLEFGVVAGDPIDGNVFVDAIKFSPTFQKLTNNKWAKDPANLDVNGWPTEDFRATPFSQNLPKKDGVPFDPEGHRLSVTGTWKVSFNGFIDVENPDPFQRERIRTCCFGETPGAATIERYNYNEATNLTTFDYVVHLNPEDEGYNSIVSFMFAGTQRTKSSPKNTGLTNLKIIRPGYPRNTTKVYTDEWLNLVKPFKTIRFVKWTATENLGKFQPGFEPRKREPKDAIFRYRALEVDWNDRWNKEKLSGKANFPERHFNDSIPHDMAIGKPVFSWEGIIEYCNANNVNPWINVPVHASDDYINQLALLFKTRLNGSLTVYVEYSNELWNFFYKTTVNGWNFAKAKQEFDQGDPYGYNLGLSADNLDNPTHRNTWAALRTAKRTSDIGKIFKSKMGARAHILLASMRGGLGNTIGQAEEIPRKLLEYIKRYNNGEPPSKYIDAIIDNGYTYAAPLHALSPGASEEEVLAAIKDGIPTHFDKMKAVASEYGLKFDVYEGGPHHSLGNLSGLANRIRAERSPELANIMKRLVVDSFGEHGGGNLYMHFSSHSKYTANGMWGLTDDVMFPFRNHKYQAALDIVSDINNGTLDPHPIITEIKLPQIAVLANFNFQLESISGNGTITWSLASGALPPGLSLNSAGLLSGIPTAVGDYHLTIAAKDSDGDTYTKKTTLIVLEPLQIAFKNTAPTIDGVTDAFWTAIPTNAIQNSIDKVAPSSTTDLSGNFKTAWDTTNLYVLVSVKDDKFVNDSPNAYMDDGIEIYLDIGNKKNLTYGLGDHKIVFERGTNTIHIDKGSLVSTDIQSNQVNTSTGYVIEAAIPWNKIGGIPENKDLLGLDVHIMDDDEILTEVDGVIDPVKDAERGRPRDSKLAWHTLIDESYRSPFVFGIARFEGGNPNAKIISITALHGTVSKSPDKATYNKDEAVKLTATADTGYEFTGWSGDASGTTNPLNITMDRSKNIIANFATLIPHKTAAPTIDGNTEAFWSDITAKNLENPLGGTAVPTSDLSANFKTAWTDSNLYFFVTVTDNVLKNDSPEDYHDDSVEFYLDINNDKPSVYGADDYRVTVSQGGGISISGNGGLKATDVQQSQKTTGTGYTIEVAIPWSALGGTPTSNTQMGLDVHVTDDDDGGDRDSKISWYDTVDLSWKDPSVFGTGILKDGNTTNPGTDEIVSIESASTISVGQSVTVKVNYSATAERKIKLVLQENPYSGVSNLARTLLVPAGTGSVDFTFTIPASIESTKGYRYVVYMADKDKYWEDKYDYKIKVLTVDDSTPIRNEIVSIESASTIQVGQNVTVKINYVASAERKIKLVLQENPYSGVSNLARTILVPSGSGSVDFTFTIPTSIESTKGYRYVVYMADKDKYWEDKYDYKIKVLTVDDSTTSSAYRYLRVTFTNGVNMKIREMEWVTTTGVVPSSAMTSNSSAGVTVTAEGNGHRSYNVFDDIYTDSGYWLGNIETLKRVTLDLGSNPVTPTAIKLYKSHWIVLNGFIAEASNDGVNWDLLLNETNANGTFVQTPSIHPTIAEGVFNFDTTSNSIKSSKTVLDEIRVYPNPVKNFLNINIPSKTEGTLYISLTSVTGKIILRKELKSNQNNSNQIDFSRLTPGLYFLEFRDAINSRQYKIIKQ